MRAPGRTVGHARDLRRTLSLPEVVLWQHLRRRQFAGLRFRRQHPAGPYVLDFYCPAARLAVEVDGYVHGLDAQARHDAARDGWLEAQGIRVLRVAAADVLDDRRLDAVLRMIAQAATPSTGSAGTSPP